MKRGSTTRSQTALYRAIVNLRTVNPHQKRRPPSLDEIPAHCLNLIITVSNTRFRCFLWCVGAQSVYIGHLTALVPHQAASVQSSTK